MEPVVVHVAVEGDGRGNLEVSWELEGDGPVEVAVGPTPETVDHEHPTAVVESDRVSLHGLGPGRHYVSVAPAAGGSAVVAAERLVALEGATNFRDLGGYRTAGGGRTRWGRVFRSDGLHALTVEDVAIVGQLGLRVVYDLRRDAEREREPSVELPDGVRRELLTMGGAKVGEGQELVQQIYAGEIERVDDDFLVDAYQRMVDGDAPTFGRLLTGLTDPGGLPALFHCSAGKDRTGVSAALLLSLLGVDETTVLEDYELTSRYYSERKIEQLRPRFTEMGRDIDNFRGLFGVPRPAMEGLLATLHERHGTVERYLVEVAGMAPETIAELRRLLVQPA